MKLSDAQRRTLTQLIDGSVDKEWLDLSGRGITRSTVRALRAIGALEGKTYGFPGQLVGQLYRITPAARVAMAGRARVVQPGSEAYPPLGEELI